MAVPRNGTVYPASLSKPLNIHRRISFASLRGFSTPRGLASIFKTQQGHPAAESARWSGSTGISANQSTNDRLQGPQRRAHEPTALSSASPRARLMVETRSGKMQDPAQERIKVEESAKPQPGATIYIYSHIHVKCNSTCVRSVVMKSNREFENRAAIIVALRAGRSPKEIVDFLKLPKTTIYRVKKQFDEADSNKEGIATRKKHSRRSDRVRGEEFVKNVKEKIDGNPGKSMRAIAKEMDVGSITIVRTIHEDLGLKSYALRKGQLLTENMKNNRKGKTAALLNNLKHDSFGMLRFFSDEKNFDVDQKVNPRNDRWICKDPSEIPVVMHTKFPASVMVLGVISSEGDVMPPHFFEKGLRMNADTYINVLETVVKPWMDMVAAGRKYVFQQDSAPAHKAKKTQSWLTLNVPSHWGPDIWPPNSPDCNPLDYYVWGVVERDVNKAPHTTIQSVKKAVHTVMTQMDKYICAAALLACVLAEDLYTSEVAVAPVYAAAHGGYGYGSAGYGARGHGGYGYGAYGDHGRYGDRAYGAHGGHLRAGYRGVDAYGASAGARDRYHNEGAYARDRGAGYEKAYAYDKKAGYHKAGADRGHHAASYGLHDNKGYLDQGNYGRYGHDRTGAYDKFKAGRISIEDDPRQGRPTFQRTDENVQKITDLIKENPRTTLLELEQDTGISKTTIGRIVTEDLRLKKTPAKFIPRFLTNEQKLCRLATCEDMLEMTRTDPEWKDKIITGDETWVYGYDPETKRQSAEWRGQVSVYGEECMSIQMVRRWRSWFLEGRQNVHDDERSGRPVTATDNAAAAAVRNVVEADRRVTIDEIMIRLHPGIEIGRSSIGTIMSDILNFRKVCARWVPRLLLENHKQQRMEAARAFLEMHQRDGDQLFSRIVTGDESWVHHSPPETKRQSMVWKKPEESAPKKAK
ncbi:hypothetical protein LAZ67_13001155, partial [Cordylochernes scorpioides]